MWYKLNILVKPFHMNSIIFFINFCLTDSNVRSCWVVGGGVDGGDVGSNKACICLEFESSSHFLSDTYMH